MGYSKIRPSRRGPLISLIIIAIAAAALAIIFIVFPADNLIGFVPRDSSVYIHLKGNIENDDFNLRSELNRLFGFPQEITAEEMAWVVYRGQPALFYVNENSVDFPEEEFFSGIVGDNIMAISADEYILEEMIKAGNKKLSSRLKNFFYFKKPGQKLRGFIKKEALDGFAPGNILAKDIYFSASREEGAMVFSLADYGRGQKLSYNPIIKNVEPNYLIYWRGINFSQFYRQAKIHFPANFLGVAEKDFDELSDYLSGEGELLIFSRSSDGESVDSKNFLPYDFLLAVKTYEKITSEELQPLLIRASNYLISKERERFFPDYTKFKEILVGDSEYLMEERDGATILSSVGQDFSLFYEISPQNKGNMIFLSNNSEIISLVNQSQGNERAIQGGLPDKKAVFYINLEDGLVVNNFLANFSKIFIESTKIKLFFK